MAALDHGPAGIYKVVDDEPAPVRDWLLYFCQALGAPQPRKVPALLARIVTGKYGLYLMTGQRGASNIKAKIQLEWTPNLPTWRSGF